MGNNDDAERESKGKVEMMMVGRGKEITCKSLRDTYMS
jgi:hypothetical protein